MQKNEKLIGILNDLVQINNDRFEGYKSLLTKKVNLHRELRMLVYNMADQSRAFSSDLISELIKLRTNNTTGASFTAGLSRSTTGIARPFAENDVDGILHSCKQREETIQKAYYDALSMAIEIPDTILNLINDQKREMRITSYLIHVPVDVRHAVAA